MESRAVFFFVAHVTYYHVEVTHRLERFGSRPRKDKDSVELPGLPATKRGVGCNPSQRRVEGEGGAFFGCQIFFFGKKTSLFFVSKKSPTRLATVSGPRKKPEYLIARLVTSKTGSVGIRSHSILDGL